MNTCGTCKFFGSKRQSVIDKVDEKWVQFAVKAPYRVCGFLEMETEYGTPTGPAYVIDASGYYAALCVSEDFGCNQWAARE